MNTNRKVESIQLQRAFNLFLSVMNKDEQTAEHSLHVGCMSKVLSHYIENNLGEKKLFLSGLLHDVGKLEMPDFVFQNFIVKTEEEVKIIREHPQITKDILIHYGFDDDIINCAFAHHERINGKGYPLGLMGEKLSIEARILGILDSYSALREDRPYRKGINKLAAVKVLLSEKQQYDEQILYTFIKNIDKIESDVKKISEKYKRYFKTQTIERNNINTPCQKKEISF